MPLWVDIRRTRASRANSGIQHISLSTLWVAVYTLVGRVSGNSSRNFASYDFNKPKVEIEFISLKLFSLHMSCHSV